MKGYTLLALLVVFGCASAYKDDEVALLERLLELKRAQNMHAEKAPEERHIEEDNEATLQELVRSLQSLLNKRTNTQKGNVAEQKRYPCGALFSCGEGQYCQTIDGTGYCYNY